MSVKGRLLSKNLLLFFYLFIFACAGSSCPLLIAVASLVAELGLQASWFQ